MDKAYGNIVLITGASSGIGKSIAEYLMNEGFSVYGTSRKHPVPEGETKVLKANHGQGSLEMVQLDVCSEYSIKQAVDYILQKEGRVDVLINNAGYGLAGSVEDITTDEALKQFDTNFLGVHRMCRYVLPVMRQQKLGLIINISSVAGILSIPFQSMYSASKFALEAMTEVMRIEVKPFGIKVVLVEPGDTKTGFTASRQFAAYANSNSVYYDRFTKSINTMIKDETKGPGPEYVVKIVAKLLRKRNPPVRTVAGFNYKAFVQLKKIVPSRLVEYVISKMY